MLRTMAAHGENRTLTEPDMNLSIAPKLTLTRLPVVLSPADSHQSEVRKSELLEPGWTQVRNADEALRFLNRAADRDPREYPVGITLCSPATGARELACWFESWAQLWTALRYVAVHLSGKQGEELKTLTLNLSQLRLSYGSDDLQVARLQRMFGQQPRVMRMGTFQDLRAGVGSYAQSLVLSYLGFDLPEGTDAEIPSYELERFIGFLRQRAFH
jgi:hypothetical protein